MHRKPAAKLLAPFKLVPFCVCSSACAASGSDEGGPADQMPGRSPVVRWPVVEGNLRVMALMARIAAAMMTRVAAAVSA
eukprot:6132099-Pleurochrysis_carterae.AAC.1